MRISAPDSAPTSQISSQPAQNSQQPSLLSRLLATSSELNQVPTISAPRQPSHRAKMLLEASVAISNKQQRTGSSGNSLMSLLRENDTKISEPVSSQISQLQCGICSETPRSPCATPCGHIYCSSCLHKALGANPRCPICRQPTLKENVKLLLRKV